MLSVSSLGTADAEARERLPRSCSRTEIRTPDYPPAHHSALGGNCKCPSFYSVIVTVQSRTPEMVLNSNMSFTIK